MKSLRSWLVGLAVGATLIFGTQYAKAQTPSLPRGISYQGLILQGAAPFTGMVELEFIFSDSTAVPIFTETHPVVMVTNGVFNVIVGDPAISPGGFPEKMRFDRQYAMTIVVNNSVTLPAQLLWSAPYSLNAQRIGGIDVSPVPFNGDIFPMPLNGAGKIDPSMLPLIPASQLQGSYLQTISGVSPNTSGNIDLVGANGVTITSNASGSQITITGPTVGGITGVFGDNGLTGGGTSGNIHLSIAPGGITSNMLSTPLSIGNGSNNAASLTVVSAESNGSAALLVEGGIGAGNPTGAADGTGLSPGSPQTLWADQISVPAVTGSALQVYNKLVSASSTIIVTPYGLTANVGQIAITSQGAGTFTVTSSSTMGTSGGGSVTAINYVVINH